MNRTTLQRQFLLERADVSVLQAIERLVGLQSQIPNPPYMGLWSRLRDFRREDLTALIAKRQIVRAAMMRSTLHLVRAIDHQQFRLSLQPALSRTLSAFFGKPARGIAIEPLVAAARTALNAAPRTNGELGSVLNALEPDRRPDALAYAHIFATGAGAAHWNVGNRHSNLCNGWIMAGRTGDNRRYLCRRRRPK